MYYLDLFDHLFVYNVSFEEDNKYLFQLDVYLFYLKNQ